MPHGWLRYRAILIASLLVAIAGLLGLCVSYKDALWFLARLGEP